VFSFWWGHSGGQVDPGFLTEGFQYAAGHGKPHRGPPLLSPFDFLSTEHPADILSLRLQPHFLPQRHMGPILPSAHTMNPHTVNENLHQSDLQIHPELKLPCPSNRFRSLFKKTDQFPRHIQGNVRLSCSLDSNPSGLEFAKRSSNHQRRFCFEGFFVHAALIA
jgi:hypothetical protein